MTAREVLINFFQLPHDEIIFQDFGCALKRGVLSHGRMFVCENFICFYANILGIKTKVVIKIEEIIGMEKQKVLGIIENAIEIQTKDQKKHFFCSFTNRDQVYSFLYALWKGQPINFIPDTEQEYISKDEGVPIDNIQGGDIEVNFLQSDGQAEQQELMKATFPLSVDKFFEMFLGDDAAFSLEDHRKARGDFEQTLTKWHLNEETGQYQRELNAVIKLVDVPFKDRSRLYKLQSYKKEKYNLLHNKCDSVVMLAMTKTLDIPFATAFQMEERWEITPLEGDRCQFRIFCWVVFLKSVMVKSMIKTRSIQVTQINLISKGVKEDLEQYVNGMRKKLESLQNNNSKREAGPDHPKFQEYEESKIMDDKLLLEVPRKRSFNKSNLSDFSHETNEKGLRETKLLQVGLIMLGILIFFQVLLIILCIRILKTFESIQMVSGASNTQEL